MVLDQDVGKSALPEAGVPAALAGAVSYQMLGAVAGDLLAQGYSVIFDSPCFYEEPLDTMRPAAVRVREALPYVKAAAGT